MKILIIRATSVTRNIVNNGKQFFLDNAEEFILVNADFTTELINVELRCIGYTQKLMSLIYEQSHLLIGMLSDITIHTE